MKANRKRAALLLALLVALAPVLPAISETEVLTCWVYYNGVQAQQFNNLLQDFNDTVGLENNIYVESKSMASVTELADNVLASAIQEVGSNPMPDLFMAYSDTAYEMLSLGKLADLSAYMSQEEIGRYVDAYIDEGRLGQDGSLYIFPVAKSTELLLLNQTAWDRFAGETNADASKLSTWEGVVELARTYFEWTDAQTPEREGDGLAFFGRDAVANYLLVGGHQLGNDLFQIKDGVASLSLGEDVMRRLWDNYYVPFVGGWFGAFGRFRSDDIKTGQIIALVGSTSGAIYFPTDVTKDDGSSSPIQCSVLPLPNFRDTEPAAVQQGAGFVVVKSNERRERAAVMFLQWFTEAERNISFSLGSGYMPVRRDAIDIATIRSVMEREGTVEVVRDIIRIGAEITGTYSLYTTAPFANSYAARSVLEQTLVDMAREGQERRVALQEQGMSYEEALASLTDDDSFSLWMQKTQDMLESALAE